MTTDPTPTPHDAPTDAELAHIRAWHWPMKRQEHGRIVDVCKRCGVGWPCHAATLVTEVDRLRAEAAARSPLWAATLAYGAAQQAEKVAKQASFAANHRGQAWFARCVAGEQREEAARALHAAYAAYALPEEEQG